MVRGRRFWLTLTWAGLLCACTGEKCQVSEEVSRVKLALQVRDLSKEMRGLESVRAMEDFLQAPPLAAGQVF